jgi:hypothetical protein
MNLVSAALLTAHTRIMNPINRIEINDSGIGASLVNAHKKHVALVATKLFVCRLQLWRIRLAGTSACGKEINYHDFIFIEDAEQVHGVAFSIFHSEIDRCIEQRLAHNTKSDIRSEQKEKYFLHKNKVVLIFN